MNFTNEQMGLIFGMPDFSTEEEQLARQYGMAGQLRNLGMGGGTGRMDWASQLSRAVGGIAGGYFQNKADTAGKALGEQRRQLIQQVFRPGAGASPGAPAGGMSVKPSLLQQAGVTGLSQPTPMSSAVPAAPAGPDLAGAGIAAIQGLAAANQARNQARRARQQNLGQSLMQQNNARADEDLDIYANIGS